MDHSFYIHRCLTLAELGRQAVGNGAMVGAVLVRENAIISEGYHKKYGDLHAERDLVQKFDQKMRSEDVLYVSLEPCCHTGKNPPCTGIILQAGIKNVVVGMRDPDPRVSGKGIEMLRASGLNVTGPVIPEQCAWLNRGFVSVRTLGRPWITLKSSHTRDGQFANPDGTPLKITTVEQDVWSHTHLRAKHDGILVGVHTVINDNPTLDSRLLLGLNEYLPWRIILDPHLRIPLTAKVLQDQRASHTIVITSSSNSDGIQQIRATGAMVLQVPAIDGVFDWNALWVALLAPHGKEFNGLTSILVEGGAKTWDLFRNAGMVDMEVILVGKY